MIDRYDLLQNVTNVYTVIPSFEIAGDLMREIIEILQISWTGLMDIQILHGKLGNFTNFQLENSTLTKLQCFSWNFENVPHFSNES